MQWRKKNQDITVKKEKKIDFFNEKCVGILNVAVGGRTQAGDQLWV